jgi:hypothetical protein
VECYDGIIVVDSLQREFRKVKGQDQEGVGGKMNCSNAGAYIIHKKPVRALLALKNSGGKVLFSIAAESKEKRIEGQASS